MTPDTEREPQVAEAMVALFDAMPKGSGIRGSDAIRKLADAMWVNGHARNPLPHDTALLSGMAVAVLFEYAERLKEEGQ